MFKILTNRKRREQAKEYVEVVFAVLTLAAFAKSQIEKRRGGNEELEEGSCCSTNNQKGDS